MKNSKFIIGALAATTLLASACAGSKASRRTEVAVPAAGPLTGPVAPSPIDAARAADPEPDVRDMATRQVPELKTVHFSYDADRLDEDARLTLRANADYLKVHPEMRVQVAGNCDQRGTVAYNLALGQRRAASVRSYYENLGVEGSRVATISFGKERLACSEFSDECWAKNRRAATLEVVSPNVAGQPTLR